MKSKLLHQQSDLRSAFTAHCRSADDIWIASAWATNSCDVSSCLWDARSQVRVLVVGLDFFQTDPAFLRRFRRFLRVGDAGAMVFHPKVYLFRRRGSFACIIGSSNLTHGGFGTNVEVNVEVTGVTSEPFFDATRNLLSSIHAGARRMRLTELAAYETAYQRSRAARDAIVHFALPPRAQTRLELELANEATGVLPPEDLDVDWAHYVRLVLAQEGDPSRTVYVRETRTHRGYLGVLSAVKSTFQKRHKLAHMTEDERRQIAGLADQFLYFGSMRGAGHFMSLVLHRPHLLDAALDQIPSKGHVSRAQFDQFVRSLPRERVKVATATRLLAMKRPDLFLCVDSQNRRQIARSFDISQRALGTFDGYWDLLARIYECPWYLAARPKNGIGMAIWDGRVALLDAFYYGR